uniref:ShKT domain-containing protein n=3 Tax=Bursaphelenchus xylophilus TaxID=6326 RepID=A0A1I7S9F2_BURXY
MIFAAIETSEDCKDFDFNCNDWVAQDATICDKTPYIKQSCRKSCGYCKFLPRKFDISRVPSNLQHLAFLIGIWRSEHGGKAFFPTIPKFTYGEQLEFALSDKHMGAIPALNYTAFAWSMVDREELHAENGYLTVQPDSRLVSMNTVMSNGFATIEEGQVNHNRIQFRLVDIGRLSFSRDLPVHDLIREWTLLDSRTMESRLDMQTLTHGMREHTTITYTKVFP